MPPDPCTVLRCDIQLVSRKVEYNDSVWVEWVCVIYLQPHRTANPKLTNVMSPITKCHSHNTLKLQMGSHGDLVLKKGPCSVEKKRFQKVPLKPTCPAAALGRNAGHLRPLLAALSIPGVS